ncbi:BglG family transcription antiterminator [Pontibacillus yanchengensis]|nr:BglG family transcription antiterminator [Pontibacillus yanchengensis]
MTGRERKIIEFFLENEEVLSIKDIADTLEVSTRTVHRDIKGVEEVLQQFDLKLEKLSGQGLRIEGTKEAKQQVKQTVYQQKIIDYTPEERQVIILSRLLEAGDPVKLVVLANELGVTVATISNDLDKIEGDLVSSELQLIRKRGYGVQLEGEEAKIREVISYLIMEHMDELDFLTFLQQNMGDYTEDSLNKVSEQLLGLVNKEKLKAIKIHVDEVRKRLTYHLADNAYVGLVVHLALALERIQKGETIGMNQEYLNTLKSSKEYVIAEHLINKLAHTFDLSIPEAETGYITMHLMGAKARYNQGQLLEHSSLSIAFKAKQLIATVSKRMGVNLNKSERLLNDLVVHLKPSVYRLQQKMEIHNTLTEQIERDYPELFYTIEASLHHVFPQFQFPKEETAFVVMHFASALLNVENTRGLRVLVVCASGIGTAKILAAKLTKQFKEIEEVEHHSLFDLNQIDTKEYDLIISTVGLVEYEDYVQVSPILPKQDIHKIEHAIRRVQLTGQITRNNSQSVEKEEEDETLQAIRMSIESVQRYANTISQLLNGIMVQNITAPNVELTIEKAADQLQKAGIIKEKSPVVQHLMDREEIGGLGIPDTHLALFHARSDAIDQASFSIHIIDEPLTLKGMDNEDMSVHTVLLMLAPKNMHQEGLEVLSFISSLIVEDEESTNVLESKDEEKMIRYLSNQLHQFFKTKRS